jgi:hypothetical protein
MYKKFRFIENGLAGDVFYSSQMATPPRAAGLFLYGIPSFIGQNEVTYAMLSSNLVAFHPHYFGTYDSIGQYSPETVVTTCAAVQKIFSRGQVTQTTKQNDPYPLPPLKLCVGHSFGALAALRGIRSLTDVTTLILLAPTVSYRKNNPNFGNTADGFAILDSIEQCYPYTYRLAPRHDWAQLMAGDDPLPAPSPHPSLTKVIAVAGSEDKYLNIPALQQNLKHIVTAFCGERIEFKLVVVPGAAHPIPDLLEAPDGFSLANVCSKV